MSVLVLRGRDGDRHDDDQIAETHGAQPGRVRQRPVQLFWRWLPAGVTVIATIGVLLAHDTAPLDIARYTAYVGWMLTLPGTLLYRSVRKAPHSLVDDLATGTAVGFALELVAWAIYSATALQNYLWTWPALVVTPFLVVPRLRRHWRRPSGYRTAPVAWSWAVAGVGLTLVAYLGTTFFYYDPVPRNGDHWYYLDIMYQLSLVGEAMHHFPPASPQAASEPLHYHWFAFAHMASASLVSGVAAPVVFFRFALPVICIASVVLMAVVGWRVSGKPWVGALAAALMFAVGEFTATDYMFFGLIGRWLIANSLSLAHAWLFTFPLIMIGVDRIRRDGLPDAPLGRGAWVLLALFAVAASGAKSTILPIVLAGFGLAGVVGIVRRQFPRNLVLAGGVVSAVLVAATLLLYGGESYGLSLSPLHLLRSYVPDWPRSTSREIIVLGFVGVAYVIYVLVRMAGIPVLAWLSWRRRGDGRTTWSVTEWYLLGAIVAGVAGVVLLGHVTAAQVYLLRSAWAFGAILSAMGLAALVERHSVPKKVVAGVVIGGVVLAAVLVEALDASVLAEPGTGPRAVLPIYWAALATSAVCAAIGVGVLLLRRRVRRIRRLGAVSILTLALVMGLPVFAKEIRNHATTGHVESEFYAEKVTPDGIALTDWLKARVSPNEVLATNGHCPSGASTEPCLHLTFWLSAYSERRVLVGGWGYVPRSVGQASQLGTWPGNLPFWDQKMFAVNEAAFYKPTTAGLAELRDRYGVRWLVVDRTVAPESPTLRQLGTVRFERGPFAVYELPR